MELIGMYKPGCKHGISRLLCVSALYMLITTVAAGGVTCDNIYNCGCVFINETGGLYEISMLGINNEGGPPFFSDIRGTVGAFDYFINPCTGFTEGGCSDVTGCQESTNQINFYTIAKPETYSFGSYTKGEPLTVAYDPVGARQMMVSLVCTPSSDKDIATVDDSIANKFSVTISSKKVCPKPFRPAQVPSK